MLNVYICEDNLIQKDKITSLVEEIIQVEKLEMKIALSVQDPEEVLAFISKNKETGIFFLDIDLKHRINGMELAQQIREYQPRCFIIFVTTHSEMSYMTFTYKVEAMDFILKDNPKDLRNRIHQCLIHSAQLYKEQLGESYTNLFQLKLGSKIREIPYMDILYFEASNNCRKIIIHTVNGTMEFNGKLKEIEKQLDNRFYRCHRSCIVNKDKIKEIKTNEGQILLENNEICMISVRQGKALLKS